MHAASLSLYSTSRSHCTLSVMSVMHNQVFSMAGLEQLSGMPAGMGICFKRKAFKDLRALAQLLTMGDSA